MIKVLAACEESQAVTIAFRERGFEAYSCDLLPCSGGFPQWHIQQDVTEVLQEPWDVVIAFPPCTHLSYAGARWFKQKIADGRQQSAVEFFKIFTRLDHVPHVAIENPRGVMTKYWRKCDQEIQPYQFGHEVQKATQLWLKNLPLLTPTKIVSKGEFYVSPRGKRLSNFMAYPTRGIPRSVARSKTFKGIAEAMAQQWGDYVIQQRSEVK